MKVKRVFVYPLVRNWRRLGAPWVDPAPVLEPGEGLNAGQWVENEFGDAPLGYKRLTARLVKSAGLLAAYPGQEWMLAFARTEPCASTLSQQTLTRYAGSHSQVDSVVSEYNR